MTRRRLVRPIRLVGRGLFSGGPAAVRVSAGRAGAGWRWALGDAPMRPMTPQHHAPLPHRSTLGGRVQLPEHLLAALVMLDVDDCDLRFEGDEAPVLDGSARPWVRAILAAGVAGPAPRTGLEVRVEARGVTVTWSGGTAPAPARTFMNVDDAARLRATFPGARPGDAVLFRDGGAVFGGRPRMRDEPTWHKLLDVLGDLGPWRARGRLVGRIERVDPTHGGNGAALVSDLEIGRIQWAP